METFAANAGRKFAQDLMGRYVLQSNSSKIKPFIVETAPLEVGAMDGTD
jgi:hypothetical protein